MQISIVLALLVAVLTASPAAAQPTIFLVRHAERADTAPGASPTMAADPDLSDAGRARAASLATVLKDAKITAIYATEFKRTQQTAAPLAKALGLTVTIVTSKSVPELIDRLKKSKGNVLVVGHSNTVPEIVQALGIKDPVTVADNEFDHLFVVTRSKGGQTLVKLRYK